MVQQHPFMIPLVLQPFADYATPTPIAWLPILVVDSAARKLDTDRMDGVPGSSRRTTTKV